MQPLHTGKQGMESIFAPAVRGFTRHMARTGLAARSLAGLSMADVGNARRLVILLLSPALLCLLGSCTPMSHVEFRQRDASMILQTYRARPLASVNAGRSNVSLHDCVRIALRNSLDLQTARWEEAIKCQETWSARSRMMPDVQFEFEDSMRDRTAWSRSDVIGEEGLYEAVGPAPGTGVTNYSTARDRQWRRWNLQVKWSPNDAAIARYLSRVKRNDLDYAKFKRIRVAQRLTGAIGSAFYRLLAQSQALPQAQALEKNRSEILRDLKALASRRLVESADLIDAQNELAQARRLRSEIALDVGRHRQILAAIMNVNPDSEMQLVGSLLPIASYALDPAKLEAMALVNRPEAYQADITHFSSLENYKRSLVKMLPRVEGYIGYFRDENKYIKNKNWIDGGFKATWRLLDFTTSFFDKRAADAEVARSDRDKAFISISILSDVRLKAIAAAKALEELSKNSQLANQAGESLKYAEGVEESEERRAPRRSMKIQRQIALCELLRAKVDRILAAGEAHAALAELDASTGINHPIRQVTPPPPPCAPGSSIMAKVGPGRLMGIGKRVVGAIWPW